MKTTHNAPLKALCLTLGVHFTALFHSIFYRNKVKPIYKEKNGRFKKVNGEMQYWELKTCVA
jgi:hypothetical protein